MSHLNPADDRIAGEAPAKDRQAARKPDGATPARQAAKHPISPLHPSLRALPDYPE